MAWKFTVGNEQRLHVESPAGLLEALESLVDTCLEMGDVFAVVEHKGDSTQLRLDADHDMIIETSFGDGKEMPELDGVAGNRLPSGWPDRGERAAELMSRAFIDAGTMSFPADLGISIESTGSEQPQAAPRPSEEGQPTIGFCFADDRPIATFIDELGPPLGVSDDSIEAIYDAIQSIFEGQLGPLTRADDGTTADHIIELGETGQVSRPNATGFAARDGKLIVTEFRPDAEPPAFEPGLIQPARDLQLSDAEGVEPLPLVLMGLFDPAGPTLVAMTGFRDLDAGETKIVVTLLSPFGQERKVVARSGADSESIASVLPDITDHGDAPFLDGGPSLVIFGSTVRQDTQIAEHTMQFMLSLVTSRAAGPLEEDVARYRAHLGKPWERIGLPTQPPEPIEVSPLDEPIEEWMTIMQDPEHARPELTAIATGWAGAIEHFGDDVATMALSEAGVELHFLGFPFLPTE